MEEHERPRHLPLDRPRRSRTPPRQAPQGPYQGICLGSGASGGYQFLGILHYFYTETNWLRPVRLYAGTSVGACVAGMMAIGYTPLEIMQYLCQHDVAQIFSFDLSRLTQEWGLISSAEWKTYLRQAIEEKWGSDPTLQDLWTASGNQVCFTTWRLNRSPHKIYLSHLTYPQLHLSEAIAMSSCIPGVFGKCEYEGECYIDGALFDNCPTQMAESLLTQDERLLAIRFQCEYDSTNIHSLSDYFKSVMNSFEVIQTHPIPANGDEIVLKNDFLGLNLQIEIEQKINCFKQAYKRTKYQLFLPKFKKE